MTDEARNDGRTAGGPSAAEAGHGSAETTIPTPEARLATLEAERNEIKDRLLRLAAEFENFKKRAVVLRTEAETAVRERVLKDVLDVADNLERATDAHTGDKAADAAAVVKGVALVLRVLQQKLERYEVRPFEAKGLPFDPHVHEAISRAPSDVPAGNVAIELQKGYRIGDKLLRPAMVTVSSGPADAAEAKSGAAKSGADN
jgi:molecular chaperone GrpE